MNIQKYRKFTYDIWLKISKINFFTLLEFIRVVLVSLTSLLGIHKKWQKIFFQCMNTYYYLLKLVKLVFIQTFFHY